MLDADLKAKWIAALRSGEYKQGQSSLFDGKGYCCLGVLATIQGCDIEKAIPDPDERVTNDLPRGFNGGLTPKQREILACRNDGSHCKYGSGRGAGGEKFDKHSFSEIADYIEKTL